MMGRPKSDQGQLFDERGWDHLSKKDGIIRHFWNSEMSFASTKLHQRHRAGDLVDPL
jgi:hypothetical protein